MHLHVVLDLPPALHDPGRRFWAAALGWPAGAPWRGHPELASLEPPDGAPYVHVQRVGGPPRVHPDLEVEDPEATIDLARRLGAGVVRREDRWTTLRSPGGLPFCVVAPAPGDVPAPRRWPEGHRSRLVQLGLDAPAPLHRAEVGFWRALLGGRFVPSPAAEFAGKWHDDAGSPLQVLFQRLEEDEGPVRMHLDLGTDDQPAEVRRLLALGAQDVGPGPGGWHVLRDPAGLPFCVTLNPPDSSGPRDLG